MATDLPKLEAEFAAIAGAENVVASEGGWLVSPASTEEVAGVLRIANARGLPVKVIGAATKQDWFNPLDFHAGRPGLVLRTGRMHSVREHAAQDLTAIVDAGCAWGEMQRQLAQQGQRVALDPLWPERATIGGIVAANDSGALRLRYGSLRDLIIGMTIVLADGSIARSGGKVVKNVAGYDMHKLMTGAAGTLGVITQVNFRLHPVEQVVRTLTVRSLDLAPLERLMHEISDSQMVVNAMQLRLRAEADGKEMHALDVMFAAGAECVEEQAKWLRLSAMRLHVEEAGRGVWLARQSVFESASRREAASRIAAASQAEAASPMEAASVFKVSLLPQDIARFLAHLQAAASGAGLRCAGVAQATGLITASLMGDASASAALLRSLRAEVESRSGSLALQSALPQIGPGLDRWGASIDALPLMRRVKQALDPNCILNPGRFVGGI